MIPEKFKEVLGHESTLSIVTQGKKEPHLIGTWNTYVLINERGELIIPAGGMNLTEENLRENDNVQLLTGSKEVMGNHGPGAGFLVKGKARMVYEGEDFQKQKVRFPWARAVLVVKPTAVEETI
jgi:hypothetical protein